MNDIFNDNVPLKTETPAFAKHVLPAVPFSEVYLMDCIQGMKHYPDNYFDLAICDPPYGIGRDGSIKTTSKHGGRKAHAFKGWDTSIPELEYFTELFRVSQNQIIWGAN